MLIGGAQLDNPAAPLSDLLRFGLQTKPGEVALLSAVRALTWSELEEASNRVAAGYLGLGLAPGDRVASLMPNRVDLVVHYLACFKAGLIATPLNYRYTAAEIKAVREKLEASQALLAKFLGVSTHTVSLWEQGKQNAPPIACRYLDDLRDFPELWTSRLTVIDALTPSSGRRR